MSLRSVKSLPSLRRTLHSSSSAPNPSHLLSSQQSGVRGHYNSLTVQALKSECKNRGLKLTGRKFELVDRIVGFEQAKTFSSVSRPQVPSQKPAAPQKPAARKPAAYANMKPFSTTSVAQEPVTVPSPPPVEGKDFAAHPVTKIPIKFDAKGHATYTSKYDGSQDVSKHGTNVVAGDIHVADGSRSRISAMNVDIGDGEANDVKALSDPLPRADKRFLWRLGGLIAAWWAANELDFNYSFE